MDVPWELLHEPEEDSGSDTADRYEYQYQVAARHCFDFDGGELQWVLCEWHTDYILSFGDGRYALVSVKHRELNQGLWTINRLCEDGGLKTLCTRWRECRTPYQTRLATNGALDSDAKKLARACARGDLSALRGFARDFHVKLGCEKPDAALQFLLSLRIESELPPRRYIRADNIETYARPMVARSGNRWINSSHVYDAVVDVVRQAARAVDNNRPQAWTISRFNSLDSDVLLEENVQKRMVDAARVAARVELVPRSGSALLQVDDAADTAVESRLSKKLRRGGIGETGIQSARRTRSSWATFEAQYSSPLPHEGDLVDDLKTRVLHEAAMAEAESFTESAPYGRKMLAILHSKLTPDGIGAAPGIPLDRLHLLGLAYQLTDECKVWWSPEFDVDNDGEVGA
ncbi:dsDNA nuclease domain-containing protein [Streptomyces cinereoruber]|uniref:dsDNA nuclease domain-containing protein n=1 Tax=Streptomyces cinereoruber TaxID=67260 RepID=UPI003625017D